MVCDNAKICAEAFQFFVGRVVRATLGPPLRRRQGGARPRRGSAGEPGLLLKMRANYEV